MALTETLIRGPVGYQDRDSSQYEEEYRRKIRAIRMRAAPLVALIENVPSETTDSVIYHWPVDPLPDDSGSIMDVYLDAACSSAYASGGVVGTALYIAVSQPNAKKAKATDVISVWNPTLRVWRRLYVTNAVYGDLLSYIACSLREIDANNALAGTSLVFLITGNAQPDYAPLPAPIYGEPTWFDNQVQTWMEATEFSNRQLGQKDRADTNKRNRGKLQSLQRLKRRKQMNYLFGEYETLPDPAGGKNITFTRGFLSALKQYAPANIFDFVTSTDVTPGALFTQEGLEWLENIALAVSKTGETDEKIVVTSDWVQKLINDAVQATSNYTITEGEKRWGINVSVLRMPGQRWVLVEDQMFSKYAPLSNNMLIYERGCLKEKKFVNGALKFIPDTDNQAGGKNYRSGVKEGWEETAGLLWENLDACAWVSVGTQNLV